MPSLPSGRYAAVKVRKKFNVASRWNARRGGLYCEQDVTLRLTWPDGIWWPIRSTARHVNHGRAVFGNLVERFDVFMGHTGEIKTLWRQDGRWFVSKPREPVAHPMPPAPKSHHHPNLEGPRRFQWRAC